MSGPKTLLVSLKSTGKPGYRLEAKQFFNQKLISDDALTLKYPVYHFQLGDVDADGNPDILLGVIKTTHFDPVLKKRLFVYRLDSGMIRSLWLSSRLSHDIVDFRFLLENGKPAVRTIEKEKTNNYLVADYSWKGFGLMLNNYVLRQADLKQSNEEFYR